MCGRFAFAPTSFEEFQDRFEVTNRISFDPSYNIAPSQFTPIVTKNSPNTARLARFGLVPGWSKEFKVSFSSINARSEGIEHSRVFSKPLLTKRCLIPSTGYYEWQKLEDEKVPHFFKVKSQEMFGLAGIYDIWKDAEGKEFYSFAIITTKPNSLAKQVHNRMPVILKKEDEEAWLNPDMVEVEQIKDFLNSYPANDLEMWKVDKKVGNPRNDAPDLIEPAT